MIDVGWLQEAIGSAAAMSAADRLGVLERLADGPGTTEEIARDCAISQRGAEVLLCALAGLGVAASGARGWTAATPSAALLGRIVRDWQRFEDVVRSDEPLRRAEDPAQASHYYPAIVPMLADLSATAARRAARKVGRPGVRVLDLGCGAAPWSGAIADRFPDARITLVDLPGPLALARQRLPDAHALEGDLFEVRWGGPYDLVIVANLLHLFDEGRCERVVARVADHLVPGGRVAVIEPLLDDDGCGPRMVTLYATGLLLRTGAGRALTGAKIEGWMRAAGLRPGARVALDGPMHVLVQGRRAP